MILDDIRNDMSKLGFHWDGQTKDSFLDWLSKQSLQEQHILVKKGTRPYLETKSILLHECTEILSGSFGTVYIAYFETHDRTNGSYCFLKKSSQPKRSLLNEGLLQTISHTILASYGFSYAIPKVHAILQYTDWGDCLLLERKQEAKIFSEFLKSHLQWNIPSVSNDKLVLGVIIQLATYLELLESILGINHRDLTGTNVLMIHPSSSFKKHILCAGHSWTLFCEFQTILIDFGFACIGDHSTQEIRYSAGTLLKGIDKAPKIGRDLFLFLASLWNIRAFRNSLTSITKGLFLSWLCTDKKEWAPWLMTTDEDNMKSMYLLTHSTGFRAPHCAPLSILKDISKTYPELVHIVS